MGEKLTTLGREKALQASKLGSVFQKAGPPIMVRETKLLQSVLSH